MSETHHFIHSDYKDGSFLDTARQHQIMEHLGNGDFGVVKSCRGGYVAKILDRCVYKGVCKENECRVKQAYVNEKRYIERIRGRFHPNLVEAYSMSLTEEGFYWIKMQHLKGENLYEKRERHYGRVPENYVAFVAQNIYSALAHLEDVLKIRDLDLRPENIMQKEYRDPKDWISSPWVLIDFGLSKDIKNGQPSIMLDRYIGTPAFSSPEKVGRRECIEGTNIYATGAILFWTILGEDLHSSVEYTSTGEARKRNILDQILDPTYVLNVIKKGLKDKVTPLCTSHVEKCLAYHPRDRFQTTLDALNSKWITQFKTAENKYDFSSMPRPQGSSQRLITPPQAPGIHKAPLQASSLPKNTVSRVAGASTGSQPGSTTKKVSSVQSGSGPSPLTLRPQVKSPQKSPQRGGLGHQVPKLAIPQHSHNPTPRVPPGRSEAGKDTKVERSVDPRHLAAPTTSSTPGAKLGRRPRSIQKIRDLFHRKTDKPSK